MRGESGPGGALPAVIAQMRSEHPVRHAGMVAKPLYHRLECFDHRRALFALRELRQGRQFGTARLVLLLMPGKSLVARSQHQFFFMPKVTVDFRGEGLEPGCEPLSFAHHDGLTQFLQ